MCNIYISPERKKQIVQHFKEESIGFGDCLHTRKGKKGSSSKIREDKHICFAFCRVNRFYSVTTGSGLRRLGLELSSSPALQRRLGLSKGAGGKGKQDSGGSGRWRSWKGRSLEMPPAVSSELRFSPPSETGRQRPRPPNECVSEEGLSSPRGHL